MPVQLKGFAAWISVESAELDSYNVETTNDGKTMTCWVASEAGKKFAVEWSRPRHVKSILMSGEVMVDGIKCGGKVMKPRSKDVFTKWGFATSPTTIKPFSFGDLQLTDDDAFLEASASADIGEICLKIWRKELLGQDEKYNSPPAEQKIHERAKKATAHRVKLGDDVQRPYRKCIRAKTLDKDPLVTFVFKYRPLDVLRANGIIPSNVGQKRRATDNPDRASVKVEAYEDRGADAARMKALEAELEALRNKTSGSKQNTAKRVKLEPSVPKGFVSGEVIDLT